MIKRLVQLWHVRPILTASFLLACAVTIFFAGATVYRAVYWSMHREEPISAWMTAGYIGKSWGVDPREIDARADLPLPREKGHPQTLGEIATDRGIPVTEVIRKVEAVVDQLRQEQHPQHLTPDGTGGAAP